MSNDPIDQMIRGFSRGVGYKAAYKLPLWLGIIVVIVISVISNWK